MTVKPWAKETEAGWEFVGHGDFERDGNSDVFWYNRLSGLSKIEYVVNGVPTKLTNVVEVQCRRGGHYWIELGLDSETQGEQIDLRSEFPLVLSWW